MKSRPPPPSESGLNAKPNVSVMVASPERGVLGVDVHVAARTSPARRGPGVES